MKHTVKYLKSAAYLLALVSMVGFVGCNEKESIYHPYDEDYSGEYVFFGGNGSTAELLELDTNGSIRDVFSNQISYEMYTNTGDWRLEFDFSQCFNPNPTLSWIEAWPREGNGDGRFTLKFLANTDQGDTRYANVNVVSGDKVIKTIAIKQAGAASVRLNLAATFNSVINLAAEAAQKTLALNVNVFWDAYVEYDDEFGPDWLHLNEITNYQNLQFSADPNYTTETRMATIVIYQISDPNNTLTVTVNQRGLSDEE